ncbi:hypothetical protein NKW44_14725 [Acetobacter lovaniensis]|jgi:hypothetical protein|uniref:hypothetical protein n=1 Tax=Acetobacter lovaniensis TaxID=104100 RepID=UPI0020A12B09|nr:hypothetical protein [Acetobacter lovaniensis]MCI1796580.1 hypothetical protein [Acetobacter lovaniensis]MCP1240914.1 hypothetical protein [Acetobacter lovaniensis]
MKPADNRQFRSIRETLTGQGTSTGYCEMPVTLSFSKDRPTTPEFDQVSFRGKVCAGSVLKLSPLYNRGLVLLELHLGLRKTLPQVPVYFSNRTILHRYKKQFALQLGVERKDWRVLLPLLFSMVGLAIIMVKLAAGRVKPASRNDMDGGRA